MENFKYLRVVLNLNTDTQIYSL